MGIFGLGNSTSVTEFEQKLKSEPQFMLNVMKLFEGSPTPDSLRAGVKKLGFTLELETMLKAFAGAVVYYKELTGEPAGGSSSGSSSSGKGIMGFTQD